jgi:hypothetical protein
MRHSRIIDDLAESLGSQAELARRIGVDDTQVCKWKDRGIPARYWPCIVAVARARRYPLTRPPFRLTAPVTPEDELHAAVADALRVLLPSTAVFNTWELRNAASAVEGARRKRLGALPGWPDCGVWWNGRVVLLELKRLGGILSPAQKLLHPRLEAAGFPVAVPRTVVEALDAVSDHGIPLRGRITA